MGTQADASIAHLSALMRRGREIRDELNADPAAAAPLAAARIWQHDCAAAVSQLSGASKAHWLSRAYSSALLVRSTDGGALVEARIGDIVARVLEVLDRARESLTQPGAVAARPDAAPPPRRFDFVRHEPLRPVLEQAYAGSARALEDGDYAASLMTSCSILEAVITDALQEAARLTPSRVAARPLAEMSFAERIAAAEENRLIGGGCARLPDVARDYRSGDPDGPIVTRREATVARQVLHVVLRDLDPGR